MEGGLVFSVESVLSFISFQDGSGMSQISFRFPGVVTCGVTLPFDKVYVSSSLSFVRNYRFQFVLVFSLNKVRWKVRVIGSVDVVFVIWR